MSALTGWISPTGAFSEVSGASHEEVVRKRDRSLAGSKDPVTDACLRGWVRLRQVGRELYAECMAERVHFAKLFVDRHNDGSMNVLTVTIVTPSGGYREGPTLRLASSMASYSFSQRFRTDPRYQMVRQGYEILEPTVRSEKVEKFRARYESATAASMALPDWDWSVKAVLEFQDEDHADYGQAELIERVPPGRVKLYPRGKFLHVSMKPLRGQSRHAVELLRMFCHQNRVKLVSVHDGSVANALSFKTNLNGAEWEQHVVVKVEPYAVVANIFDPAEPDFSVAHATFWRTKPQSKVLTPVRIATDEGFQRRGLMSAMYNRLRTMGYSISGSGLNTGGKPDRSPAGHAFRISRGLDVRKPGSEGTTRLSFVLSHDSGNLTGWLDPQGRHVAVSYAGNQSHRDFVQSRYPEEDHPDERAIGHGWVRIVHIDRKVYVDCVAGKLEFAKRWVARNVDFPLKQISVQVYSTEGNAGAHRMVSLSFDPTRRANAMDFVSVPHEHRALHAEGRGMLDVDLLHRVISRTRVRRVPAHLLVGRASLSPSTGFSEWRVERADVSRPIVLDRHLNVLDGRHRLVKAVRLGHRKIRARVATDGMVRRASCQKSEMVNGPGDEKLERHGMSFRTNKNGARWEPSVEVRTSAKVVLAGIRHPVTPGPGVVAYGQFTRKDAASKVLHPHQVWVDEEFRRQGMASAIYNKLRSMGFAIATTDAGGLVDRTRAGDEFRRARGLSRDLSEVSMDLKSDTLTRRDIVKALAEATGVTQGAAQRSLENVLGLILHRLNEGGRVELRNFGVFETRTLKPKVTRNPTDLRYTRSPYRKVVVFRAGRNVRRTQEDTRVSRGY